MRRTRYLTYFGGWNADAYPRGVGIEFRADYLGTLIMLVVVGVAFLVALYSKLPVAEETPEKEGYRSTRSFCFKLRALRAFLLRVTLSTLYVLIEVAALTGYGLIAMGSARAAAATFKYVILGTIGAFFLSPRRGLPLYDDGYLEHGGYRERS